MNGMKTFGNRIRILEIALMVGLVVLFTGMAALRTQKTLADKMVRLHVLANSDSPADQTLKLQVRDAVLERTSDLLEYSTDRQEAEGLLRGALLELEQTAADVIQANGYQYPVTAELVKTDFPTRDYDGFSLPAGEYFALRIIIGDGDGQNWWCVVFPPLCAAASTELPVSAMAAGLTEEEVGLITGESTEYVLKFKVVEWWEHLRQKLS